jgi:hypothetical protein
MTEPTDSAPESSDAAAVLDAAAQDQAAEEDSDLRESLAGPLDGRVRPAFGPVWPALL